MRYDPNIYLTDEQYRALLLKIRETLSSSDFKVSCFDSTVIGNKYAVSNCGLCNKEYTEPETALFPEEFPERNSMKYLRLNHHCPFDLRKQASSWGCFFSCYLFSNLEKKEWDLDFMRQLVEKTIANQKEMVEKYETT